MYDECSIFADLSHWRCQTDRHIRAGLPLSQLDKLFCTVRKMINAARWNASFIDVREKAKTEQNTVSVLLTRTTL